jgi:hypothetical protein
MFPTGSLSGAFSFVLISHVDRQAASKMISDPHGTPRIVNPDKANQILEK